MAFQITQFQKALNSAGARSSLFEVSVTGGIVPTTNESGDTKVKINEDMRFRCRATTIPGLTVTPIVTTYKGRELKIPGEMEFADWSVTIMNDNGSKVRRALERWMAIINAHGDNAMKDTLLTANDAGTYPWTGTASVTQFDKAGSSTHVYSMVNCWPTSIDPIDVSYDNTGTIQEYGATFALDYWTYAKGVDKNSMVN